MKVEVIDEAGYDAAVLGFSFSYNTTLERAKELLPLYAFKNNGENKFLRAIQLWMDISFPRYLLTELDTYKVSTVRLSESTMHTLCKKELTQENFEYPIYNDTLEFLNFLIKSYKTEKILDRKKSCFLDIKNNLPEGFLQRIVYNCNYATLQNIYAWRYNHRLPQWKMFLDTVLSQIEHPEFVIKGS